MANYYIADTHFGHENVIRFDSRPFASVEEMDNEIIARWNRTVSKNDHIYILGDFTMRSTHDVAEYTKKLRGHLHLIWGNHDKRSEHYRSCFESADEVLRINDTVYGLPRQVCLCHYWMPFVANQRHGLIMLHGHTHVTKEHVLEEEMKQKTRDDGIRCEAYNVGCMFQDYALQTLEQIIERQERDVVI